MSRMSTLVEHTFEIENLHERMQQVEAALEELNLSDRDADRLGREVDAVRDELVKTQRVVLQLSLETARAVERLFGMVEQCAEAISQLPAPPTDHLVVVGDTLAITHVEELPQ